MRRPSRIVLASQSPQRRRILEDLGVEFEVMVSDADELTDGVPREVVVENSLRKARAVAELLRDRAAAAGRGSREDGLDDCVVIGSDTEVVLGERVLGKPRDAAEAREYISALAGATDHFVISGLALVGPGGAERSGYDVTYVRFRPLSHAEIDAYVATGEWQGRSGGYAIQQGAAALVDSIDGDELNVVGLPVRELRRLAPELLSETLAP